MGITIPNLTLAETGVVLANAYAAFSRNALVVQPVDAGYLVHSSYNVWNSLTDRHDGYQPISTIGQDQILPEVVDLYTNMYVQLKETYPDHEDVLGDVASMTNDDGVSSEDDLAPEDPVPDVPVEDPVPDVPVEDPVPDVPIEDPVPVEDPAPENPTPDVPAEDPTPADPTPIEDPAPL